MTEDFDGRVAIVTGGASGIGAAIAAALRQQGAIVAVFDLDPTSVPSTMTALAVDVADDESVQAGVAAVVVAHGRIDIIVNNAGIGAAGGIADNDDAEWHRVFDINVLGLVRVTRAALPYLRRSDAASVVNTCSIAATAGLPQRALYSATKGAVLSLTRAMAADLVQEGIRVNSVNPGTADTPWVNRLLEAATDPIAERAALAARQPHGRLVTPDEIAQAVLYLASPLARSTTGTSIAVDGGMQELRPRSVG